MVPSKCAQSFTFQRILLHARHLAGWNPSKAEPTARIFLSSARALTLPRTPSVIYPTTLLSAKHWTVPLINLIDCLGPSDSSHRIIMYKALTSWILARTLNLKPTVDVVTDDRGSQDSQPGTPISAAHPNSCVITRTHSMQSSVTEQQVLIATPEMKSMPCFHVQGSKLLSVLQRLGYIGEVVSWLAAGSCFPWSWHESIWRHRSWFRSGWININPWPLWLHHHGSSSWYGYITRCRAWLCILYFAIFLTKGDFFDCWST